MAEERTGMVQVDLNEDDWKKRAEKLAADEAERIALKAKKKTHNKKWNEELIQLDASIAVLTEEVETHTAWVPAQTDMFGANDEALVPEDEPPPARRRRGRRGTGAANANHAA